MKGLKSDKMTEAHTDSQIQAGFIAIGIDIKVVSNMIKNKQRIKLTWNEVVMITIFVLVILNGLYHYLT